MNDKIKTLTGGTIYWSFKNPHGLSNESCNRILDTASDHFNKVSLLSQDGKSKSDDQIRKGQSFFDNQQFVYDLIWPYMNIANKNAEWNFEISSAEDYQITKYEVGDFYKLHIDSMGTEGTIYKNPAKPNFDNKTRKLSMTVNLNDDYEGGDLLLFDESSIEQKTGNAIFFPSYLPHQVTPVTKGTRYSLVMWFLGKPWR